MPSTDLTSARQMLRNVCSAQFGRVRHEALFSLGCRDGLQLQQFIGMSGLGTVWKIRRSGEGCKGAGWPVSRCPSAASTSGIVC